MQLIPWETLFGRAFIWLPEDISKPK